MSKPIKVKKKKLNLMGPKNEVKLYLTNRVKSTNPQARCKTSLSSRGEINLFLNTAASSFTNVKKKDVMVKSFNFLTSDNLFRPILSYEIHFD